MIEQVRQESLRQLATALAEEQNGEDLHKENAQAQRLLHAMQDPEMLCAMRAAAPIVDQIYDWHSPENFGTERARVAMRGLTDACAPQPATQAEAKKFVQLAPRFKLMRDWVQEMGARGTYLQAIASVGGLDTLESFITAFESTGRVLRYVHALFVGSNDAFTSADAVGAELDKIIVHARAACRALARAIATIDRTVGDTTSFTRLVVQRIFNQSERTKRRIESSARAHKEHVARVAESHERAQRAIFSAVRTGGFDVTIVDDALKDDALVERREEGGRMVVRVNRGQAENQIAAALQGQTDMMRQMFQFQTQVQLAQLQISKKELVERRVEAQKADARAKAKLEVVSSASSGNFVKAALAGGTWILYSSVANMSEAMSESLLARVTTPTGIYKLIADVALPTSWNDYESMSDVPWFRWYIPAPMRVGGTWEDSRLTITRGAEWATTWLSRSTSNVVNDKLVERGFSNVQVAIFGTVITLFVLTATYFAFRSSQRRAERELGIDRKAIEREFDSTLALPEGLDMQQLQLMLQASQALQPQQQIAPGQLVLNAPEQAQEEAEEEDEEEDDDDDDSLFTM